MMLAEAKVEKTFLLESLDRAKPGDGGEMMRTVRGQFTSNLRMYVVGLRADIPHSRSALVPLEALAINGLGLGNADESTTNWFLAAKNQILNEGQLPKLVDQLFTAAVEAQNAAQKS